jgi:hypothetical protein
MAAGPGEPVIAQILVLVAGVAAGLGVVYVIWPVEDEEQR